MPRRPKLGRRDGEGFETLVGQDGSAAPRNTSPDERPNRRDVGDEERSADHEEIRVEHELGGQVDI